MALLRTTVAPRVAIVPLVLAIALAVIGSAVVAVVAVVGAVLMVVMSPVSFYISLLYLFSIKRIRGGEKEEERKK